MSARANNGGADLAVPGIHHVTAIAGQPQANVDFYSGLLGLRLVKKTVNFDDPTSYHLYYGDRTGHPGTLLTFFSWPRAPRGHRGVGQIISVAFRVPASSLTYWTRRLDESGVPFTVPGDRFGEALVRFADPDGLEVELVGSDDGSSTQPWDRGGVPAEHAIRGCHLVTLNERDAAATVALLTDTLGYRILDEDGQHLLLGASGADVAARLLVRRDAAGVPGRVAVGSIHHVAFRVQDDAGQLAWRRRLIARGVRPTPVMDRNYFHSIYFREPGGILFEIATDSPGFAIDEPVDSLGTTLKLPEWLEPDRSRVEALLPPIEVPSD